MTVDYLFKCISCNQDCQTFIRGSVKFIQFSMEFPNLGSHCAVQSCRRLDFLPVKCSGCHGVFCKDHYPYNSHNCKTPDIKDKQVPICPLCGAIVPVRPGELPDDRVGDHIDTACQSKPALELKGKLFTYSCSVTRCKKRELVPFLCDSCRQNFCIAHRNELDHDCKRVRSNSTQKKRLSSAGAAAIYRAVFRNNMNTNPQSFVNHCSRNTSNQSHVNPSTLESRAIQEEEDRQLALALAASLQAQDAQSSTRSTSRTNNNNTNPASRRDSLCNIS